MRCHRLRMHYARVHLISTSNPRRCATPYVKHLRSVREKSNIIYIYTCVYKHHVINNTRTPSNLFILATGLYVNVACRFIKKSTGTPWRIKIVLIARESLRTFAQWQCNDRRVRTIFMIWYIKHEAEKKRFRSKIINHNRRTCRRLFASIPIHYLV